MKSQNADKNMNQGVVKNEVAVSPFVIFEMPISRIRESVLANLGQTINVVDFERIKIPAGGGAAWTIQNLDGETTEKELSGIIVTWRDTRAYWSAPMGEANANNPPNCSSVDACTGIGEPGGDCRACRYAQFGTGASGEGQACKLVRQLFFLRQDTVLPVAINLPPSSLKSVRQYFMRLAARGLPCYSLITKIGLEKAQNARSIVYSRATFAAGDMFSTDQAERVKAYAEMLKPLLEAMPSAPTFNDHLAEGSEIV